MNHKRIPATALRFILLTSSFLLAASAHAQFSGNYETNTINATTNTWPGWYQIGNSTHDDWLIITNGGWLIDDYGLLGGGSSSAINNGVLVTGPGSVWSNLNSVYVGDGGGGSMLNVLAGGTVYCSFVIMGSYPSSASNRLLLSDPGSQLINRGGMSIGNDSNNNRLIVTNGASLVSSNASIGVSAGSSGNSITVTGPGSVWTNLGGLTVGEYADNNLLIISAGGVVLNAGATISADGAASGNRVVVTDPGSVWSNRGGLQVGAQGNNASLVVSNGATVYSTNSWIGIQSVSVNNSVTVTGPGSLWNNSGSLIIGEYGDNNLLTISDGGKVFVNGAGLSSDGAAGGNRIVVTGPGSVFSNAATFTIGSQGGTASLVVSNGATVYSSNTTVGIQGSSTYNALTVTGAGSLWTNSGTFTLGYYGGNNSLAISRGAAVHNGTAIIGTDGSSGSNWALLTDTGSVWKVDGELRVGSQGSGNTLIVSNGASLSSFSATLADNYLGYANVALVTGPGSVWSNATLLVVGKDGYNNQLNLANDGTLVASNIVVGLTSSSYNNQINLAGGNLVATNADGTGTVDIRRGAFRLIGGTATVDRLVFTNGASGTLYCNNGLLISHGTTRNSGQNLVVGVEGSGGANFIADGGTHSVADDLYVGHDSPNNRLVVTNGALLVNTYGWVGNTTFSTGNTVTVTGSGSVWTNRNDVYFGENGGGNRLYILDGGTVHVPTIKLGDYPTAGNNSVTIAGTGSLLNAQGEVQVGHDSSGNQVVVTNGGKMRSTYGTISLTSSSSGNSVTVTGSGSAWSNSLDLKVAPYGQGTLTVADGGVVNVGWDLVVADVATSWSWANGTVILSNGSLVARRALVGLGNAMQSHTETHCPFTCYTETTYWFYNSAGAIEVSNGSLVLTNGESVFGVGGNGRLTVSGGEVRLSDATFGKLGAISPAGTYGQALSGTSGNLEMYGGSLSANGLVFGDQDYAHGQLNLHGGEVAIASLILGRAPQSCCTGGGSIFQDGGFLYVTNAAGTASLVVGLGASGYYSMNGGTSVVDRLIITNGFRSYMQFNGGMLRTKGTTIADGQIFTVGDGVGNATLDLLGGTHTFADGLQIQSNATLKGTGTIVGDVTLEGTLAPGHSPGLLTVDGDLAMSNSAIFDVELGGLVQGISYDFVHVLSNATLDGTLAISFVDGFQNSISPGDVFTNLTADLSLVGLFSNIGTGSRLNTADGFGSFLVTYAAGNNLILSDFIATSIPEPSTLALLALGAVAFLRRRNQ